MQSWNSSNWSGLGSETIYTPKFEVRFKKHPMNKVVYYFLRTLNCCLHAMSIYEDLYMSCEYYLKAFHST